MYESSLPSRDRSSVENSLPFDPEPSCQLDFGLHAVACDARFALQDIDDWKSALALAQLVLDVERLRRKHAETCPECNTGEAA